MTVRSLHDRAMEYADHAFVARRAGDALMVKLNSSQAYKLERKAAAMLSPTADHEPSRGVLYRSAAWLAIGAEQYATAEELALAGLEGVSSPEIRRELEDVLAKAREILKDGGS